MSKKALIVFGGWKGHTPKESAEVFQTELTKRGFEVIMSDTLDSYADAELMSSLNLIVPIWTMGEISGEQWKGLSAAVKSGVGCASFHGGIIDAFRMNTDYQFMTGGQWVSHPGGCIPSYHVRIVDTDHEITENIGDFELKDTEQYYIHFDPANDILCDTKFTGEHGETDLYPANTVMPYAWTRQWSKGRVFVACWGHTYKDFDVPEAKELVARGMEWAAKK